MMSGAVLQTKKCRIFLKPHVEPPLLTAVHRSPPALAMLSRPLPLCLILKFSSCRDRCSEEIGMRRLPLS